MYFLNCTVNGN
jgi:hypothetical protein